MDRIFKIGLQSPEWRAVCLHLILFPSSLKKNKNALNVKYLNSCHCIQPKQHERDCSGSEIVVKQIFNLNHRPYNFQKYLVCKSQVEIGHTFVEISWNIAYFTNFSYMFYHVIFIFFKECFLTRCYLKRALFRLENHEFLRFFLWCQFYRLEDAKRNALDLTGFRNQVHHWKFLGEQVIDSSWRT